MRLASLPLLLLLVACSTGPVSESKGRTRIVFQPDPSLPGTSPYPSDLAVNRDGPIPPAGVIGRTIGHVNGLSGLGPIWIRFQGPALRTDSLPGEFAAEATAPIVISVQPVKGDPYFARYRITYNVTENLLALHLKTGLPEKARVTVVVRKSLHNVLGESLVPDDAYRTFRSASEAAAETWATQVDPVDEELNGVFAFGFTVAPTQSVHEDIATASAPFEAFDASSLQVYSPVSNGMGMPVTAWALRLPVFGWAVEIGSPDAPIENLAAVVYGKITVGSRFSDFGDYNVTQVLGPEANSVEFVLALPDIAKVSAEVKAKLGTPPRFPLVIFGHGYTACKETMFGLTDAFAKQGIAVIGIDAPGHGLRGGVSCGQVLPTGFGLNPSEFSTSFAKIISETRQLVHLRTKIAAAVDVLPAGNPDGIADLAVSSIGYIGQSMGAIAGAPMVSMEPDIHAAVFNVGAANLASALLTRASDEEGHPGSAFDPAKQTADIAALALAVQLYDPLNFITALEPKNILLQQAEYDELIPNLGSEWQALALDAVQLAGEPRPIPQLPTVTAPIVSAAPVHARSVFANVHHAFLILPDDANRAATLQSQRQAATFLSTSLRGAKVEVLGTK